MTPWELVKKSEHSHQRAVFAWANCAALYGFEWAAHSEAYDLRERQKLIQLRCLPTPELSRLFAIHNQGHGDKIRGAMAKAEGVKPGVPDMMLPVKRMLTQGGGGWAPTYSHGLFVELKRPKGLKIAAGATSDVQDEWNGYLISQGYTVCVAVGWIAAANAITKYMGSEVRVS